MPNVFEQFKKNPFEAITPPSLSNGIPLQSEEKQPVIPQYANPITTRTNATIDQNYRYGGVKDFFNDVLKKSVTDFLGLAKSAFIETPARFGASTTLQPDETYTPQGKGMQFLLGKEPVQSLTKNIADTSQMLERSGYGKASIPVAMTAVLGAGIMDITGGGGKEQVARVITKINNFGDAVSYLKKLDVADDLIKIFAAKVVSTKTVKDAKLLIDKIIDLQKTTKVTKSKSFADLIEEENVFLEKNAGKKIDGITIPEGFKASRRTITGDTVDIKKLKTDPTYFKQAYESTFARSWGTDEKLYKTLTKQLVPEGREASGYLADLYNKTKLKVSPLAQKATSVALESKIDDLVKPEQISSMGRIKTTEKVLPKLDISKFERAKNLTPEGQIIEEKAFQKILVSEKQLLSDNKLKHGKEVNPDNFRPFFKDVGYVGSNAADVQESASYLGKKAFTENLKNPEPFAIFTSGGSGAGKSSALEGIESYNNLKNDAAVILDTNLSSVPSMIEKVSEAVKAGKKPEFFFVYREPLDALENGVVFRMKNNVDEMGRIVPTEVISKNTVGSWEVAQRLQEVGAKVHFIDNSLSFGKAKEISFDEMNKKIKYPSNLEELFDKKIKELFLKGEKNGGINYEQYKKYIAKETSQELTQKSQKIAQTPQVLQKSAEEAKLTSELHQVIDKSNKIDFAKNFESLSKDITNISKGQVINLNRLNISQKGKEIVNETAEAIKPLIESKTGKRLSNQQVVEYAEKSSKYLKQTVGQEKTLEWESALLKTRQKLATAAETGKVDQEFIDNIMTIKTIGTDIARKLQSLSIGAEAKNFNMEAILEAILKTTDKTEDILKAAKGVDFNDYKQAIGFYRQYIKPTTGEWIDLLRYNSMLSSPVTHMVNAFSNLMNTTMVAPLEKALTGGIDFLGSKLTGNGRKYFAGESLKFIEGYFKNIKQAVNDFSGVMKGKDQITQLDIRRIPLATQGKTKVVENILSFPLRLLEGSDKFFMRLAEGGEMAALNYRKSMVTSVKFIEKQANDAAKYRLFRQELKPENQGMVLDAVDSFTQAIESLRNNKNPIVSWVSKFTVPFVRTPMNILKQGIEYSPLGVSTLKGAKNKTEQLSKAIIGSTMASGAAVLAASDRLTFGEPIGEGEKQAFRQAGRQAYSIKIGDKWVSYQKLPPPLAFNFAITAGIKEAYDKKKIDDNFLNMALSSIANVGEFFADQSYVKSIGDMLSSVQGGEAGLQRVISNYPLQLIPFRAMSSWFARLLDASQRKIDTDKGFFEKEMQTLMTNFPLLSMKVPARLDKDGNPIPNYNRFWNSFPPVRVQTENKEMEKFFQQREDFYKQVRSQSDEKSKSKDDFMPTYNKIQELKNSGNVAEAKNILNGLTDEQYKIYKTIKSSEKSSNTTEGEIRLMPTYQKIQSLKKEGKTDEAKNILNNLTDDEYEIYKKLKARFP